MFATGMTQMQVENHFKIKRMTISWLKIHLSVTALEMIVLEVVGQVGRREVKTHTPS